MARIPQMAILCCCAVLSLAANEASAVTLCVNTGGTHGCYSSIAAAVGAAHAFDVIQVARGTYKEEIVIGLPLTLLGAGSESSVIDASGLSNGIFVDGYDHAGLAHITIAGFTVKNAQYEGILVVSASDVTVRDNVIEGNDKIGGNFTGAPTGCPGQPAFEMDETGDCGGGLHLIGVANSLVTENLITLNADGVLLSDETAETHDVVLQHNAVVDNPGECGIVLASHPNVGNSTPPFLPHWGVDHNTISENLASANGVQVGGAGVGIFSDGMGQGHATNNDVIHNILTENGIGGFSLHTHVGPAFGLPADNLGANSIIGNYIAGNLADSGDTATPGRVGININSGGGGSPVWNMTVTDNVIRDEDVDIAINTPAVVNIHLNSLLGGETGVANICSFDHASCTGSIDASQNYWGCRQGPGHAGCTTASGGNLITDPPLTNFVDSDSWIP